MANEATKKDLADLEKRVNKAMADEVVAINKAFADLAKSINSQEKDTRDWAKGEFDKLFVTVTALTKKCV